MNYNCKFNLDLFKEMFYHEIDQKEKINSKIGIPVGISSLPIGGVFYYVNQMAG